jgi:hypothetical protein
MSRLNEIPANRRTRKQEVAPVMRARQVNGHRKQNNVDNAGITSTS